MCRICSLLLSSIAPLLLACSTTSQEYVESSRGYAVTQGRVVEIMDLTSRQHESLADGVAIHIDRQPCRVTVDFGGRTKNLDLPPGSILLLAEDTGYVMQPHEGTQASE